MAVVPPNDDINKLVKAFGFEDKDLISFDLHIAVDKIVTIEVEMYPTKEEIKKGAKAYELVSKKYVLVEKEDLEKCVK